MRILENLFLALLIVLMAVFAVIPIKSDAGQLGNYPQTTTLNWTDLIPLVHQITNSNQNINWSSLINLISEDLNWTDIKAVGTQYGDHSGINWQAFKA